ncbi:MAG: hypothetical protein AAFR01_11665, partial [Pseudomonadota bacterium]
KAVAALADTAALHFLRDREHRNELLRWLRLSGKHPRFHRDGLNARAMNLGTLEAFGAGIVLGRCFAALDRVGLAGPLVNEADKTRTAAAIAVFHRGKGEDPFSSGRAFYQAWLAMERFGLKASALSVLADWDHARETLHRTCQLAQDRFIVGAFRLGVPKGTPRTHHERLPVDELIV